MSRILQDTSLLAAGSFGDTNIYRLQGGRFRNRYFVLSHPHSRRLLASPETIGYDCCRSLLSPTIDAFSYLQLSDKEGVFDILTILRGGLNYPLEQAAYCSGLTLSDIQFLSCERVIEDKVIKGLEIKYEKIVPTLGHTLLIGDIIATGDTMRKCLDHFMSTMHNQGGSVRRVIFFTIGGTRAIELMEEMSIRYKALFPGFEGFDCFFHEGIFTVYKDKGASGINIPDIDFSCNGGAVAPEMRMALASEPHALLEKCIIYDGGARRYEISIHCDEVLEYWQAILERSALIDPRALVAEKLGYGSPLAFSDWCATVHLSPSDSLRPLWEKETSCLDMASSYKLVEIATERINTIRSIQKRYE
mgnify:CR=1 FL=1